MNSWCSPRDLRLEFHIVCAEFRGFFVRERVLLCGSASSCAGVSLRKRVLLCGGACIAPPICAIYIRIALPLFHFSGKKRNKATLFETSESGGDKAAPF